jgi:hypothetical protein
MTACAAATLAAGLARPAQDRLHPRQTRGSRQDRPTGPVLRRFCLRRMVLLRSNSQLAQACTSPAHNTHSSPLLRSNPAHSPITDCAAWSMSLSRLVAACCGGAVADVGTMFRAAGCIKAASAVPSADALTRSRTAAAPGSPGQVLYFQNCSPSPKGAIADEYLGRPDQAGAQCTKFAQCTMVAMPYCMEAQNLGGAHSYSGESHRLELSGRSKRPARSSNSAAV